MIYANKWALLSKLTFSKFVKQLLCLIFQGINGRTYFCTYRLKNVRILISENDLKWSCHKFSIWQLEKIIIKLFDKLKKSILKKLYLIFPICLRKSSSTFLNLAPYSIPLIFITGKNLSNLLYSIALMS